MSAESIDRRSPVSTFKGLIGDLTNQGALLKVAVFLAACAVMFFTLTGTIPALLGSVATMAIVVGLLTSIES